MSLIIQRLDGTTYNLKDYDMRLLSFVVPSPTYTTEYVKKDGINGQIDVGTTIDPRTLTATIRIFARDSIDFVLLRNDIFRIFKSLEAFYLIDERQPYIRWKVKTEGFSPEQIGGAPIGDFSISFICADGVAESVGTTLDPMTFDSEKWGVGQGLTETDLSYVQTVTSFSIYNAGDLTVKPEENPLVITFKGTSTNLKIRNNTTGEEWSYIGTTAASDTIELSQIYARKNNLSIFKDTNKKTISLAPGWNSFVITGASGTIETKFNFRFYYV